MINKGLQYSMGGCNDLFFHVDIILACMSNLMHDSIRDMNKLIFLLVRYLPVLIVR